MVLASCFLLSVRVNMYRNGTNLVKCLIRCEREPRTHTLAATSSQLVLSFFLLRLRFSTRNVLFFSGDDKSDAVDVMRFASVQCRVAAGSKTLESHFQLTFDKDSSSRDWQRSGLRLIESN